MSRLTSAILIGIAMLAASAAEAQAANHHSSIFDFGLIDGVGGPDLMIDPGHRVPAIDLRGDHGDDGAKPPVKLGGDWVYDSADGSWHQSGDTPDWQQHSDKPWKLQSDGPWSVHTVSPWKVQTASP